MFLTLVTLHGALGEEREPPGPLGREELGGQEHLLQLAGVLYVLGTSSCKVWRNFSSRSLHLAELLRLPSLLVGCTRVLPQNQTEEVFSFSFKPNFSGEIY